MRCNHANAADAKFCGECGAGLLRRFCGACSAVNDAESRFCQACGHALPDVHASASPLRTVTKQVPDLTDEVLIGPEQPHQPIAVVPLRDANALTHVTAEGPVLAIGSAPPFAREHRSAYRVPMLLAIGGATSLALAVWIWPRMDSSDSSTRRPLPVPLAAVEAVAAQPTSGAAVERDAIARADAALAQANAVAGAQPTARVKEAGQAETRRPAIERAQSGQRPAVDSASVQRASVQRAPAKPATPPPDCTPQVDALGLCAPGATIKGR
jgi:hypothetical protein